MKLAYDYFKLTEGNPTQGSRRSGRGVVRRIRLLAHIQAFSQFCRTLLQLCSINPSPEHHRNSSQCRLCLVLSAHATGPCGIWPWKHTALECVGLTQKRVGDKPQTLNLNTVWGVGLEGFLSRICSLHDCWRGISALQLQGL